MIKDYGSIARKKERKRERKRRKERREGGRERKEGRKEGGKEMLFPIKSSRAALSSKVTTEGYCYSWNLIFNFI